MSPARVPADPATWDYRRVTRASAFNLCDIPRPRTACRIEQNERVALDRRTLVCDRSDAADQRHA